MPKFAANLTVLFTERPFLERFAAAKAAGFDAVEVLFPYEEPPKLINRQLLANDQTLVLINCPPPNYTGGQRGFGAVPGLQERFRRDFRRTLRYCDQLKPKIVHIMAGCAAGPDARSTFVDNLIWAAKQAPNQNLTIEPINQTSMPGYFLSDFDLASEILHQVNAPNLGLQFDAFHAQMITGNAMDAWQKFGHLATHVQAASAPDRHEPDKGEIDYPALFQQIAADSYKGYVSGEYNPKALTEDGLDWLTF
jgi:hydroxypyruvate isomerase